MLGRRNRRPDSSSPFHEKGIPKECGHPDPEERVPRKEKRQVKVLYKIMDRIDKWEKEGKIFLIRL